MSDSGAGAFSARPQVLQRLYRRKQFVLGPRWVPAPATWTREEVAGGQRLTAHPELEVVTVRGQGVELTLIGFAIDPALPDDDDAAIARRVAAAVAAGSDLFATLAPLGGRYLMLMAGPAGDLRIVGDAAGSVSLVWTRIDGESWCAAQGDLLAQAHGLDQDPAAIDFITWMRERYAEFMWPVDATPYQGVERLLPNHFLELRSGQVTRYWPRDEVPARSVAEAMKPIGQRMSALIAAASRRLDLTLGICAGRPRWSLSCCRWSTLSPSGGSHVGSRRSRRCPGYIHSTSCCGRAATVAGSPTT